VSLPVRRASVRALAKINLDLRVLGRRPDGYHEIRTVFQTISLADRLSLEFEAHRKTELNLDCGVDIPDNLALKAAQLCLDEMRLTARVSISLEKHIPMGAGLGGGSSDAAAVLLALPALANGAISMDRLVAIARELGSDVPFFLIGGRAVGLGRGTELYPLPDLPRAGGVLVAPGIHVSTPAAYKSLNRGDLTTESLQNNINSFQAVVWGGSGLAGVNDFEVAVFRQHPSLRSLKRKLIALGANPAMMSGSGSSIFGIFGAKAQVVRAIKSLGEEVTFPISLVSRARYRSWWFRWLGGCRIQSEWPPRSRYAR
jgi:4-diphosphocytidyl-2-C-methyl-D-erythritol kinase